MCRLQIGGCSRLTNGETRKAQLDQVIHKDTFNLFYTPQAAIIPVETRSVVPNGCGQLYGIRRTEAIART
jgi:hypothetical protein